MAFNNVQKLKNNLRLIRLKCFKPFGMSDYLCEGTWYTFYRDLLLTKTKLTLAGNEPGTSRLGV